jgi:hypothetical protein
MEILAELSTIAGAGILVSYLFDYLRSKVHMGSPLGELLYRPDTARYLVLVMSALLSSAAAYGMQALGGPDAEPAVTAAWAAVTSQIVHAIRDLRYR